MPAITVPAFMGHNGHAYGLEAMLLQTARFPCRGAVRSPGHPGLSGRPTMPGRAAVTSSSRASRRPATIPWLPRRGPCRRPVGRPGTRRRSRTGRQARPLSERSRRTPSPGTSPGRRPQCRAGGPERGGPPRCPWLGTSGSSPGRSGPHPRAPPPGWGHATRRPAPQVRSQPSLAREIGATVETGSALEAATIVVIMLKLPLVSELSDRRAVMAQQQRTG